MSRWDDGQRPLTIAILAMGGEGGGVLSDWIVAVGEDAGFTAQSTSVAGVAQRTGATVYYVELYPSSKVRRKTARSEPVLSLFPTPGQVDVVIASELMEAGRAIQRGFSTPDRTTLIASTNRVYAIQEKIALGDGRVDDSALLDGARAGSKRLISADFNQMALEARSVISASLFGALAGSAVLPFERSVFEAALRKSGKGVDASLLAFASGFDAALDLPKPPPSGLGPVRITIGRRPPADPVAEAREAAERLHDETARTDPAALVGYRLRAQAGQAADFPAPARSMLVHGIVRTAVFQSPRYADLYIERVASAAVLDSQPEQAELTIEVARHTALWMAYQDTIQVALQKVRSRRMEHIRGEAKAAPGQLMNVREYLHPQVAEITDMLPVPIGSWLAKSKLFGKVVGALTRKGMIVNTTSLIGFTLLWGMASFRPIRPISLRYAREQRAIDDWLELVRDTAGVDYALGVEVAKLPRVLKGYGATHEHGLASFTRLVAALPTVRRSPDPAGELARLAAAALADEDGAALTSALSVVPSPAIR